MVTGKAVGVNRPCALAALLFLFGEVLEKPLESLARLARAKRPARVPTVMSREEIRHVLASFDDIRTVQERLGHRDLKATMIYTQHAVEGRWLKSEWRRDLRR
jgi:site-specific recombinase XerD